MFGLLSVLFALISGLCWVVWALGLPAEHPNRVLGVAIGAIVLTLVFAIASWVADEF